MRKRILSMLLTATMALTMLPTVAFAVSDKGGIAKNVNSGTIYFGKKVDGTTPVLYRVVAKDKDTITLFYDGANVANSLMQYDGIEPNGWSGSAICQWLNGDNFLNNTSVFTAIETNAITSYGTTETTNFHANIDISQKIVLPSVEEVEEGGIWEMHNNDRSNDKPWWLRSLGNNDYLAAYVYYYGDVNPNGVDAYYNYGVRPAFKLNLSSVLFASATSGAGAKSGTAGANLSATQTTIGAQKLTIVDSGHTLTAATTTNTLTADSTITVNYTGASTGSGVDLAAMITDNTGAVTYYGTLAEDLSAAVGTANVTLPAGFDSTTMDLKLFTETINGDSLTDYASAPVAVTVEDNTAPTLTAVGATRTSETNATVKFTSNEGGQYYYAVVASGDSKPTISTNGSGTTCGTTEETITLTNLTKGVKDIYIVVKDAAGNVSDGDFKITIPEYITPNYAITANSILDFGSKTLGYAAPSAEQEVTIKNTGNESVTLTQPVSTKYNITPLSKTTIGINETATFKIKPKTGLATGVHDENLKITTDKSASATVALKFKVTNKPSSGGGGGGISYNYHTITVNQPYGGRISSSTGTVIENTNKTIFITPDQGFIIKDVIIDGESVGPLSEYTFKNITKGHSIKVIFELKKDGKPGELENPFQGINNEKWFREGLNFILMNNLINTRGTNLFSPSPSSATELILNLFQVYLNR